MSEQPPNVQPPTPEEIREKAAAHHIDLTDEEVEDFAAIVPGVLAGYERLDELVDPRPRIEHTDRDPGYKPGPEEDPLNAFVTKCRVSGADDGPLAGYEVGIKDNVAVAGVEMTLGSKLFEGYVPSTDATIVTRLLDAGATITGKLNMEDMAFSGSGELSATGPVLNPRDENHIAGGSSSGSAAAVASGAVDVAIGGDQGGSIRIPASWSGIVGHKPTHSLVPYTGIVGLGRSFDHAGPMASSGAARASSTLSPGKTTSTRGRGSCRPTTTSGRSTTTRAVSRSACSRRASATRRASPASTRRSTRRSTSSRPPARR
jgi:amidase